MAEQASKARGLETFGGEGYGHSGMASVETVADLTADVTPIQQVRALPLGTRSPIDYASPTRPAAPLHAQVRSP